MMKRYLAWKRNELDSPTVACAAPAPIQSYAPGTSIPGSDIGSGGGGTTTTTAATNHCLSSQSVILNSGSSHCAAVELSSFSLSAAALQQPFSAATTLAALPSAASHQQQQQQLLEAHSPAQLAAALAASVGVSASPAPFASPPPTCAQPVNPPPSLAQLFAAGSPRYSALAQPPQPTPPPPHSAAAHLFTAGGVVVDGSTLQLSFADNSQSLVAAAAAADFDFAYLAAAASVSQSLFAGPSAFSVVAAAAAQHHQQQQAQQQAAINAANQTATLLPSQGALAAAALYPQLMCLPSLLTPAILRSSTHMSQHQQAFKPIPNNDGGSLDVASHRLKEPRDWSSDDVIAWLLDVARRRNIPLEDINVTKFAIVTGAELASFSEIRFLDFDPIYGSIFFQDFSTFLHSTSTADDRALEELVRTLSQKEEEEKAAAAAVAAVSRLPTVCFSSQPGPSSSQMAAAAAAAAAATSAAATTQQQLSNALSVFDSKMRMTTQSLASTLSAALSPSMGLNSLQTGISPQSPHALLGAAAAAVHQQQQQQAAAAVAAAAASPLQMPSVNAPLPPPPAHLSAPPGPSSSSGALKQSPMSTSEMLLNKYATLAPAPSAAADYDSDDSTLHGVTTKIRKNKDGRPRKRSQHTKGNKLWEFIRDALKDPNTCPSVVRWEDPHEGVFRIVESEKLARLWGERKNNQKMTYEKLSRAMRTYYEKQILVPVPKTGLYPKKLVYKFGPGAAGWENCRQLVGIAPPN